MSVTSKCKVGALRTGEFAAETALNVGAIGFEGVRLTGVGIRKVGETLEAVGILGSSSCRVRIDELNRQIDQMVREIDQMAKNAETKRQTYGDKAGGEPEVVLV